MKARTSALVLSLGLLLPISAMAQEILPADPSLSIVSNKTVRRDVLIHATVIPLEAFNKALANGHFVAANDYVRREAEASTGLLNEPETLGFTTDLSGFDVEFSGYNFLVVKNARYVPDQPYAIEATEYFHVTGQLSGTAAWMGNTVAIYQAAPANPDAPRPFPARCCPGDPGSSSGEWGHKCVDPDTAKLLSSSPDAVGLNMGTLGRIRLYHLQDARAYPNDGVGLTFADINTPPANANLQPLTCAACTRYTCETSSCASDADCAPDESCGVDGLCEPRRVQCLTTKDCNYGQMCLWGRCVGGPAKSPQCVANSDCPGKQRCDGGVCRLPGAQAPPEPASPQDPIVVEAAPQAAPPPEQEPPAQPNDQSRYRPGGFNWAAVAEAVDPTPEPEVYRRPPRRVCPTDAQISALHCLDPDFLESACGQRYSPAAPPPHATPAGERPNQCRQLIAQAVRNEPKRNPRIPQPLTRRVCERAPPPPPRRRQQGNGLDMGIEVQAPPADLSRVQGGDPQQQLVCRDESLGTTGDAQADYYNEWFAKYGPLYKLDAGRLIQRHPEHARFRWDLDADFDQRGITYEGGSDTLAAQTRRQQTLSRRDARTRRNIQSREDRWRRQEGLANCAEYVFQRFYDHSRFLEEAALAADDWAVFDLAFGAANQSTSIGTRVLNNEYRGPRDFLGNPIGRYRGGRSIRIGHSLPGAGENYFKNVFFSVIVPPSIERERQPFAYRELLRMAQDPLYRPQVGGRPIERPDFRHVQNWRYHRDTGSALRQSATLKAFDHFATFELPRFVGARNRLHRAIVEGLGPFPNTERYPSTLTHEGCLSCACYHEKWILPWHFPYTAADRFFEWRDQRYDWNFVDLMQRGDAVAHRQGIPARTCIQGHSEELRRAFVQVEELLTEAELKGYLHLTRASVADWSPRWFAEQAKSLYTKEKEEAFQLCRLYTNDDFGQYQRRLNAFQIPGARALRNYAELEASFQAIDRAIENLPPAVRETTVWHAGDAARIGSHGFGVNYSYSADVDVDDYVFNAQPAPERTSFRFDTHFNVGVRAFGIDVPLIQAGMDFDTQDGVELPVVRILDFDLLDVGRDLIGNPLAPADLPLLSEQAIRRVANQVNTFTFSRTEYAKALASAEFSTSIPVLPGLHVTIAGGIVGTAGATTAANYARAGGRPVSFEASMEPFVMASAFLEGGVSAIIASVSIRTNLTIIDFSLPLHGSLRLSPSPVNPRDLLLAFQIRGTGELEMLSGNVKLRICVGIWPFEVCDRRTIFDWNAAFHQSLTLFSLGLDQPVSVELIALARSLQQGRIQLP